MASEARRGLVRIVSNYARLLSTLVIGVATVPVLLSELGKEGYGLVLLIGASVGIGAMVEEVVRQSLIRELAHAHHSGDRDNFKRVYNGAYLLCAAAMVLSIAAFAILMLAVPWLDIPPSLHGAARVMLACEGAFSCLLTLCAPATNMLVVTERFVIDNAWGVFRRLTQLAGAILLAQGIQASALFGTGMAGRCVFYSAFYTSLNTLSILVVTALVMARAPHLRPSPGRAGIASARAIVGTFGWNTAVVLAMNLYDRIGAFIMNLAFGLVGNTVFGIGLQLAAYVRMVSMGMNMGVDSVAARLSTRDKGNIDALRRFTRTSTRLHTFSAAPAVIAVSLLTEPILKLWIARRGDPEIMAELPRIAVMCQVLLIPLLSRSISDAWTRILYGAGHVRQYAPMVLLGGLLNPALAYLLLRSLPDPIRYYSPAISYAVVFTLVHVFLIPMTCAGCLGLRFWDLFRPVLRPAATAAIASPILIVAVARITDWTMIKLAAVGAAYAAAYIALCLVLVMDRAERAFFRNAILRRLRPPQQKGGPATNLVSPPRGDAGH